MNFIDRHILKEFDALLSKYHLSSTVHFEGEDKHIQINLIIPDYFDEEPKHGYWTGITTRDRAHAEGVSIDATEEERQEYHDWFNHITHCSVCGSMFDDRKIKGWKGCPNCLSILDLERPKEKEM